MRPLIVTPIFLAVCLLGSSPRPAGAEEDDPRARFAAMSEKAEAEGLAEPFRGILANGQFVPGLYAIRETGASTGPVVTAAQEFLDAVTPEQRGRLLFPVEDAEWRKWMNQHFYRRQGVSLDEMDTETRASALGLLQASLSDDGFDLLRDIMRLNHTLGELNDDNFDEYGEWLYWFTMMGRPSASEPWGWQLDGHHAVINYFLLGDQVVMSPVFLGSEPVIAESGRYAGTRILDEHRDAGLAMVAGLSEAQRQMAIVQSAKDGNNNVAEAFRDNIDLDYVGIPGALLSIEQQRLLLELIGRYVGTMREGHAAVRMEEVREHLDDTYFAWIGGTAAEDVFYYRVFSPVILIEFDHQKPANLRDLYPPEPNRQHIHTVMRTPNGNDYGKDLLRQHYAIHPHDD